jgi:hypothetical protein
MWVWSGCDCRSPLRWAPCLEFDQVAEIDVGCLGVLVGPVRDGLPEEVVGPGIDRAFTVVAQLGQCGLLKGLVTLSGVLGGRLVWLRPCSSSGCALRVTDRRLKNRRGFALISYMRACRSAWRVAGVGTLSAWRLKVRHGPTRVCLSSAYRGCGIAGQSLGAWGLCRLRCLSASSHGLTPSWGYVNPPPITMASISGRR